MLLFGALTYSKTFLVLLCLYWLLCLFYLIRDKHYILAVTFTVSTVLLALLLSKTLFATTLYRITNASSVNELTTGRLVILDEYLREISSSPGIMLWGKGLSAHLLKKGTHNLFLEIQYYLGLFGLILFLLYFGILIIRIYKKYATGNAKSKLFNYSPLIVFIVIFFRCRECFLFLFILCFTLLLSPLAFNKMTAYKGRSYLINMKLSYIVGYLLYNIIGIICPNPML